MVPLIGGSKSSNPTEYSILCAFALHITQPWFWSSLPDARIQLSTSVWPLLHWRWGSCQPPTTEYKTKICLCQLNIIFIKLTQIGPALHLGCKAFSDDAGCKANITDSKRGKKKKEAQTRVVGGVPSSSPMPWMVSCLVILLANTLLRPLLVLRWSWCWKGRCVAPPWSTPGSCSRRLTAPARRGSAPVAWQSWETSRLGSRWEGRIQMLVTLISGQVQGQLGEACGCFHWSHWSKNRWRD